MPGLYAQYKVYTPGEVLTAADLNASDQNHIANQTPQMTDDYSLDTAQRRTQLDPATGLPSSMAGEIAQIRYALAKVGKVQYWDQIVGPPTVGLRGFISGFKLTNEAGDLDNDITISPGTTRSDDNTTDLNMTAPITKQLDVVWAVGSGQGMLDGGAKQPSTWYHLFAIYRQDTELVDVIATLSSVTPVMPSGYTKKRRIGAIRTGSDSKILQFIQDGDWFWFKTPPLDVNVTNLGVARTAYTITVPDGFVIQALLNCYIMCGGEAQIYFSSADLSDLAPSVTVSPLAQLHMPGGSQDTSNQVVVMTDIARQIQARSNQANTTLRVATLAYRDQRGRDT